ncbi:DUF5696 domain-containing protein [Paenibacillus sp.]|uniref:DUF5696 domain-containing protein n=1 Tax=Paenibacillus sp. TaxID=58172 RepID=UPI002811F6D5|nr:DUF5696 domain-containing protein [Paenibacillus sp.]
MRNKRSRNIWAAATVAALLAATVAGLGGVRGHPAAVAAQAVPPVTSARAAETSRLTLDFDPRTAEVVVTDVSSGAVWSSNPIDRETDGIAKGVKKQDLHAQLLLDYIDPLGKPFQLNSYIGSVQEGAFTWKQIDGGVEVLYEFPKAGFAIPVSYRVEGDAFVATIDAARIEQRDKYRLVNIYLVPFFGAGGLTDEGYLFVPDGSGALIRFNNDTSIYRSYNERVYGGDQAIASAERSRLTEAVRLPVFGMKRNDEAFLAVIHQGAYQAGILAESSRKSNQYNTVSSYLNLTEFQTDVLMAGSLNEKSVVRPSAAETGNVPFEVRFYFLNGDDADYAGMASRYRRYLEEEQGVKPRATAVGGDGETGNAAGAAPLLVELVGGVKKRETFLGIPYRTVDALTSYQEAEDIVDRLRGAGLTSLAVRYEGWMAGGLRDEVPTALRAESKLGGARGFKALVEAMHDKGIAFYPVVDPVQLYENGNGFHKFFDAAKNISRAPALQHAYRVSNGTKDPSVKPWYLMKPESVREAVDRFSGAAEDGGLRRAALQSIDSMVYSDFRRDMLAKNETGRIWEASLAEAAAKLEGLSFDDANAYAFPYAESVANVPLQASGFDVEDESIPFYSMAISGLIPAYGEPINLKADPRRYLLKLIETGTMPTYRFIAKDGSRLIGTDVDDLYSGDFDLWFEDVAAQAKALSEALAPALGQPIVEHERLREGVYRTTFANGVTTVVNDSGEEVSVDGERIDPYGYRVR